MTGKSNSCPPCNTRAAALTTSLPRSIAGTSFSCKSMTIINAFSFCNMTLPLSKTSFIVHSSFHYREDELKYERIVLATSTFLHATSSSRYEHAKNFIQMASPFHRYFSIGSSELADDLSYPFITFIAFLNEVASFSFQPSHRTISHSSTLSIPNEQTRRNNE